MLGALGVALIMFAIGLCGIGQRPCVTPPLPIAAPAASGIRMTATASVSRRRAALGVAFIGVFVAIAAVSAAADAAPTDSQE